MYCKAEEANEYNYGDYEYHYSYARLFHISRHFSISFDQQCLNNQEALYQSALSIGISGGSRLSL